MSVKKLHPGFRFNEERLEHLRAVAPEAFADGRINWDSLQQALSDYIEEDSGQNEHFGLSWPGKRESRRLAHMPSMGTLHTALGEGIVEENTHNLFLEGENLEVLKLLQKSYAGQVKCIYLDPPYNTGNDFVYKDNFREPLESYLRTMGDIDEQGTLLTTNKRAGGRFHSNWLSMMYPRLVLARQLLSEDGVIMVSIDDNEVCNLRLLMNEVFGDENFVSLIVVQTNPRGRTLDKFLAKTHEYIAIYAKSSDNDILREVPKDEAALAEYDKVDSKGRYRELELRNRNPMFNRANRPNLYYEIFVDPSSERVSLTETPPYLVPVYPLNSKGEEGCWTWGKEKVKINVDLLVGRQVNTGAWRIFRKDYVPVDGATTKAKSIWLDKSMNHENGKEELGVLFGKTPFDFPKSVALVKKCVSISTAPKTQDLVLDFFAGSCTTAHAVMELNEEDGGNRRFIMVQISEATPPGSAARAMGYPTLADIGKDRIRKAIGKIKKEQHSRLNMNGNLANGDLGFKVLKLGRSNYKTWQNYEGASLKELETLFDKAESPLIDDWKDSNLLIEVLLLQGFPLDSTITQLPEFPENKVHLVEAETSAHRLIACFDPQIARGTIDLLRMQTEDVFVCLDSALTDEAKMRLEDKGNVWVI